MKVELKVLLEARLSHKQLAVFTMSKTQVRHDGMNTKRGKMLINMRWGAKGGGITGQTDKTWCTCWKVGKEIYLMSVKNEEMF